MNITFLGATKTVTGSNFLVEAAGKKFLVDCGLYQGNAEQEYENSAEFDFNINEIDFVLLTHAHIDHSGRIPKLYNEGYRNSIYAHKATCDLCSLMLPDSGHIQEMEIQWQNKKRERKGEKILPPLYTAEEAARCLELFVPVTYDKIIEISSIKKTNLDIMKKIYTSRIISLENISIKIHKEEDIWKCQFFDEDIAEITVDIEEIFEKKDLKVKEEKKIKLFL